MNPSSTPPPLPLRDIHLPEVIGFWPLAPGWWVVLGGVILALVLLGYWLYLQRQPTALKEALKRLDEVVADERLGLHQKSQEISRILKQMALTVSDRQEVAKLSGEAWVEWMASRRGQKPLSFRAREFLEKGPYRSQHSDFEVPMESWVGELREIMIDMARPPRKAQSLRAGFEKLRMGRKKGDSSENRGARETEGS